MCVHACGVTSVMSDSVTLRTVVHQAPLSMGFSRQEYWSGLPCPPPGDLPGPGIEPTSLMSPALAGRFFTTSTTWKAPQVAISFGKKKITMANLLNSFRSMRLKCKSYLFTSEDRKCKFKMNWTAAKSLTRTEILFNNSNSSLLWHRRIVKYLCMIEAAIPDKEKIHNPPNNRFGGRQTSF